LVVGVFGEDFHASDGAVEDVIDEAAWGFSGASGHLSIVKRAEKNESSRPFHFLVFVFGGEIKDGNGVSSRPFQLAILLGCNRLIIIIRVIFWHAKRTG
jgi:hypothetical protein